MRLAFVVVVDAQSLSGVEIREYLKILLLGIQELIL